MVKQVNTTDLKSVGFGFAGSIPASSISFKMFVSIFERLFPETLLSKGKNNEEESRRYCKDYQAEP